MSYSIAAAVFALALPTPNATSPRDDGVRVRAALAAAHNDARARLTDQFAASTVSRDVIGLHFRLAFAFRDGRSTAAPLAGAGYYTYENGALRLIVSLDEVSSRVGAPQRLLLKIGTRERPGRPYVASNAFGARARVAVSWLSEDGLAINEGPEGMLSPYTNDATISAYLREHLPRHYYWLQREMPGAEARQLALAARVEVEGTVAPLPEGGLTECRSDFGAPTLDSPREVLISQCWIGATVDRIAIVDGRNGEVLGEWRRIERAGGN